MASRTPYGHFKYPVMLFGLVNTPAAFQHFMNDVFQHMLDKSVIIYLDDILVFAATGEELMEKCKEVLKRFKENDLYCKPKKCKFAVNEIECLGHIISADSIKMEPVKIEAILQWPRLTKVKQTTRSLRLLELLQKIYTRIL